MDYRTRSRGASGRGEARTNHKEWSVSYELECSVGRGKLHITVISAARTVFDMSIAIVIGPTPPGTGVIFDATSRTDSKSTSPCSFDPALAVGSVTRFVPTSITTAPGFTMSPLTI